jgi:heterodisulfide reductase subunit C
MELDACTHCGLCTLHCSVGVAYKVILNANILPSEKIGSLRTLAKGVELSTRELMIIQEGLTVCTNCNRCTLICPVGINLQELWFSVRETLFEMNVPEFGLLSPLSFHRGMMKEAIDPGAYGKPVDLAMAVVGTEFLVARSAEKAGLEPESEKVLEGAYVPLDRDAFSHCYTCMTCTVACPVVKDYEHPGKELGLLPHQLMHAVGLRLWELVFGSKMLWDCLGCYQCQEYCPMKVPVTDVIVSLKNVAVSRAAKNYPRKPLETK